MYLGFFLSSEYILKENNEASISFLLLLQKKFLKPTDKFIDRFAELLLLLNKLVKGYNTIQYRKDYAAKK